MKDTTRHTLTPRLTALGVITLIAIATSWALARPAFKAHISAQKSHSEHSHANLPAYGSLPPFAFQTQEGNTLNSETLAGKVWIADFIYTSCTEECPLMTAEMARLRQKITPHHPVIMVSFTVDPENDTPAVLKQYANHFQARAENWKFLTGSREALYQLAQQGFHLPAQAIAADQSQHDHHGVEKHHTAEKKAARPFLHSQKFVLVDKKMQIRGYYDSTDPNALKKLLEADLPALLSGA